jgi:hypothetical protein
MGCDVVNLDMSRPFTAARARNEGLARALSLMPGLVYVQFVDGDCEMADGWLCQAVSFLDSHLEAAVACGRRRERFPNASIYNRLCDIEWDTPVGKSRSCGGDALMRIAALVSVGSYRSELIAGEEPELCVRLRAAGWSIWRLDADMTLHDAAIHSLSQWWLRNKRAGHAYAEGAYLHGLSADRHNVRETLRAAFWGFGVPLFIAAASLIQPWLILLILLYPLQIARLALRSPYQGSLAWQRAYFLILGKFAETQGIFRFVANKIRHQASTLIEYK